jgi:DNA repair protein RecO
VAKNSRKSRIRFAGHLESFSLVDLTLRNRHKDELVWIDDSQVIEGFLGLRNSIEQIALAALFCDISRIFLQESNPDPRVFDFLALALNSLNTGLPEMTFLTLDGLRLLGLLGYQIQMTKCPGCGKELTPGGEIIFSFELSSVIHTHCSNITGRRIAPISWETLTVIKKSFELQRESYSRLRLNRRGLTELTNIFKETLRHLMGFDTNTLQFIERMGILSP